MQLFVAIIAALVMGAYYAFKGITDRGDPTEPPTVNSSIPFVGHIIGMIKKKADYYVQLHLYLGTSKAYIVNSPRLTKLVQKQAKVLSFPPIAAQFSRNICATSKEAGDIVDYFATSEDVDDSDVEAFFKMFRHVLAPGPDLDSMNRAMIESIAASMQRLGRVAEQEEANTLMLSTWLRHEITLATTNSVYGPLNPFSDSKVEEAFWNFTEDLGPLMINVLPSLVAPKGHSARKVVADAFYDYYIRKGHESGSAVARKRHDNGIEHKIPLSDIARYEVGGAIAFLVNTTPAAFWMLFYIYADPDLLRDCRQELDAVTTVLKIDQDRTRRVVDFIAVKKNCPLLASIFTEMLRCRGISTSVRKVMQDTILDERYLLKKGNTVMMPAKVLHSDADLWGPDVQAFQPRRFMKGSSQGSAVKHDPAAFRGFGGGSTLCPGRHFATTEILATVAIFVLRYNMKACNGWNPPTTHKTSMASAVMEPDTDIEVQISFRAGFERDEWAFGLNDSEVVLAIAAEDQVQTSKDE